MENHSLERQADNLKSDLHAFVNKFCNENVLGHKKGLALSSDCDQVVNDLILEIENKEQEVKRFKKI